MIVAKQHLMLCLETEHGQSGTTTYVIVSRAEAWAHHGAIIGVYLGLQVVGVLVVKPDLGVVAVAQAVGGHPVLLVSPALGHDPSDQSGRPQVQLQPLVIWNIINMKSEVWLFNGKEP